MSKLFDLADIPYMLFPLIPAKWMYPFVRLEAKLMHRLDRKSTEIVRKNLTAVFGDDKSEQEIDALTYQFFEHKQLRTLLLYLLPKFNQKQKDTIFPIEGLDYVVNAVKQGNGAIICGSHLSSALTLAVKDLLRDQGYDVRLPSPIPQFPYPASKFHKLIDKLSFNGHREYSGGIFHAQFNIRPMVQVLKENNLLILMGDGSHSAGFAEVDFLGRKLLFTTGAAGISRLTGSPIIPYFIVGTPPEGLRIIFEEPITIHKTDDAPRDLQMMVADYTRRLERHLRDNIPSWQHWLVDDALQSMCDELQKPLAERYHVH